MKDKVRTFLSGPMIIDLRSELQALRKRSMSSRKTPDLLWRKLCGVVATSGSSVNSHRFLSFYDTHLRFDLLPASRSARTQTIFKLLEEADVPRLRRQKSENLSKNYEIVKSLGGPAKATQEMFSLSGKRQKQEWIQQFNGVGTKYSNDIWMDICDPDFTDSIALDARVKSFASDLGLDPKSPRLEKELLQFAKSCNLSGWEFDRLVYNYGKLVFTCIRNNSRNDA